MKKSVSSLLWILGSLLLISLSVLIFSIIYQGAMPKLVEEINNSAIGAILTAVITVFLLNQQTKSEEIKERNAKVFEKKQEVFHNFLDELKKIVQDGEITIAAQGENANLDKNIDELKDLIFQLGYLQMHADQEKAKQIFSCVAEIIKLMNDFSTEKEYKQNTISDFYSLLSEQVFKIIAILKSELYGLDTPPLDRNTMKEILQGCNFFIDTPIVDKHELQKYFWDEIQNQLTKKGYNIVYKDFTQDINQYYAKAYPGARKRHMWYGVQFEIFKIMQSQQIVNYRIELGNNFIYGFPRVDNEQFAKCVLKTSPLFKSSPAWSAYKYSDKYDLDFCTFNSQGFEELKDARKREKFIAGLVDEIDMYIKKFKEIAAENNL